MGVHVEMLVPIIHQPSSHLFYIFFCANNDRQKSPHDIQHPYFFPFCQNMMSLLYACTPCVVLSPV